jgi:hypothetical protein
MIEEQCRSRGRNSGSRIVTSRGRKYRQAVWYRWDASRKRAVTEVVAHLGPVSPRRSQVDRRKVYWVLAAIQRGRLRQSRRTSIGSASLNGRKRPGRSQVGDAGGRSSTRIDREAVAQSAAATDLQSRVLTAVARSPSGCSRKQLAAEFEGEMVSIPGSAYGLLTSDHVGMALTILHEAGRLARRGRGVRGDPFVYTVVPRDTSVPEPGVARPAS